MPHLRDRKLSVSGNTRLQARLRTIKETQIDKKKLIKPPPPCNYNKYCKALKELKDDFIMHRQFSKATVTIQMMELEELQKENAHLKSVYETLQTKKIEDMGKIWCSNDDCENEAKFGDKIFYCSKECEELRVEKLLLEQQ